MGKFQFKYFSIQQDHSTLKVGTDSMILGACIPASNYRNILDVGTGTGVLALMAKQQNPQAKITAIDIDEQSEIDCRVNFQASQWNTDLSYINKSIFDYSPDSLFDCIISNPPYYEDGLLSSKSEINAVKHTKDFDLKLFFNVCSNLLTSSGEMWTILPSENMLKWIDHTTSIGLFPKTIISVYGKPEQLKRVILNLSKTKNVTKTFDLTIRSNSNDYTDQYKELTKEFHSKTL